MFRVRFVCVLLALVCVLGLGTAVTAAEVDCDAVYCFTSEDFQEEEPLRGICIMELPETKAGTVMLGSRVLQPGDILTAEQLTQMTFLPLRTQVDQDAVVTYLPIYENRVAKASTMTIAIRGKEDKAPVAEDSAIETYKNLPNEAKLKVSDPEGQQLTYTLVRGPKRGTVELREDGSFTYTPKKNKVGVDSFTFTATDPAGNVSRTATVTIQILKPTDSKQYTDTVGHPCRFEAEWMRNTGLFVGEKIGGKECFYPDKEVSRGEFLAMMIQSLDIPVEEVSYTGIPEDTPDWLKPYLAAALRSGLIAGWPSEESGSFLADQAITGAEAAVMLQNALDLSISQDTLEASVQEEAEDVPAWASVSMTAMRDNGVELEANEALTRGDAAEVLYQVSQLALDAPGMAVFRMQK
jgi:hypothetical protein